MIAISEPKMQRARVSGDKLGQTSSGRTNSVHWQPAGGDPVLEVIEDKICDLVRLAPPCFAH